MFRSIVPVVRPFVVASAALLLFTASLPAQTSQAVVASRIVSPIDDNSRVTLHGYIHPLATAANDRGAAPDSMALDRMHLVLKRSADQETTLKQLVSDLHTPGTANYHKWLTPDQFGQQFGPSDQDIATVESWLSSHGFQVSGVKPGKQIIEFSGNVGQVREAFGAKIHRYQVNGSTHFATSNEPQIPAALASVVGGFVALNDFNPKSHAHVLGQASYNTQTGAVKPNWTYGNSSGENFLVSPADFAVQYDLNPLYSAGTNGSGQSIAIINESNINVDLVNQFRTLFNLPANPPNVVIDGNDPGVNGINNPDGENGAADETYIDVEWSGAVAPQATIDLVIGADTALESGLYLAAEHAVYSNLAPVMSLSFGECELGLGSTNSFFQELWEQAAAQGITVMVSAGDNGSAACDDFNTQYYAVYGQQVSGFASTPYNVAVGGTDFYYSDYNNSSALSTQIATYWNTNPSQTPTASLLQVIPEQPWNDSQYGLDAYSIYQNEGVTTIAAGSGGASNAALCSTNEYDSDGNCTGTLTGYTKPSWQTGTGVPADKVRDLPDVSLFAADGVNYSYYPFCYEDGDCQPASGSNLVQISGGGGTSFAAPAFAGIMALVNQKYGRQGQADFVLYPLKAQFPAAFHDITQGTNSVPCNLSTVSADGYTFPPTNCISVSNPITVTDPTFGSSKEGQIGTGTTAEYNAAAGYNLATGLGTVDANQLVTDWGSVSFKSTTTTLTPSSTSFTHGSNVTFTGSVTVASGTPSGSVALMTDSPEPLNASETYFTLSNGSFNSGSVSYMPGGTYNVWGQYSGDGTNGPSTSQKTQITVNPESSEIFFNVLDSLTTTTGYTAIGSGTSNIPYGTQLILSAQPVPSSQYSAYVACVTGTSTTCPNFTYPTGTVAFADNGSTINTAQVNAEGDAEFNGAFAPGAHSIVGNYSGDKSYNASSSSAFTFSVVKATPGIVVSASNAQNSTAYVGGQPTIVNIQVENTSNLAGLTQYGIASTGPVAAPTGNVTVTVSPAISGSPFTVPLSAAVDPNYLGAEGVGTVTIPAPSTTTTYTVTVSYSGDTNYNAVSGSQSTVTINPPSSTLLASTTTASLSGSISPNSSITITGSITGQSGHPAPTGSLIIFSSGYSLGSLTLSPPASGDVTSFSLTLNSANLPQGANYITLQYSGDANYAVSATNLSTEPINNPLADFSMVPNSVNIPVTAGSSGTDTIQLYSVNGFGGTSGDTVTFTCTGPSGITCSATPSSYNFTANGSSTTSVSVTVPSGTTNGNYTIQLLGTDSTGEFIHTLGLTVIVTGSTTVSPTFALSNSGNVTVTEGSSGTSTISVTPSNGFTGNVALACSSSNSTNVSCSLSPTTAAVSGTTAVTSTLTVTTTSTSGALQFPMRKFLTGAGGTLLAVVLFFGIPARRRSWTSILGLLVVILTFASVGCGSSGGSGGSGGGSGSSQSYTVTVTGTSGSITQTTSVSVTVNQ